MQKSECKTETVVLDAQFFSPEDMKQLEYQKSTDERFDKVFQYIEDHVESMQYKL